MFYYARSPKKEFEIVAWSDSWDGEFVDLSIWGKDKVLDIFDKFGIPIQATSTEDFQVYCEDKTKSATD